MLSGKVYKCIVDLRYFLVLSLLVMMNVCVVYKSAPQHLCGCQRTSFRSQFFASIVGSRIELSFSGLCIKYLQLLSHLSLAYDIFNLLHSKLRSIYTIIIVVTIIIISISSSSSGTGTILSMSCIVTLRTQDIHFHGQGEEIVTEILSGQPHSYNQQEAGMTFKLSWSDFSVSVFNHDTKLLLLIKNKTK